jgi:hypothetical protein
MHCSYFSFIFIVSLFNPALRIRDAGPLQRTALQNLLRFYRGNVKQWAGAV